MRERRSLENHEIFKPNKKKRSCISNDKTLSITFRGPYALRIRFCKMTRRVYIKHVRSFQGLIDRTRIRTDRNCMRHCDGVELHGYTQDATRACCVASRIGGTAKKGRRVKRENVSRLSRNRCQIPIASISDMRIYNWLKKRIW